MPSDPSKLSFASTFPASRKFEGPEGGHIKQDLSLLQRSVRMIASGRFFAA